MYLMKRQYISILIIIMAITLAFTIYVNDSYQPKLDPNAFLLKEEITKKENYVEFVPDHPKCGFIFYPGGKVDYESYFPLMQELMDNDILCILIHMPLNLAVFDENAAKDIQEKYPNIQDWYIGGHSLGGVMASSYVNEHLDEYKGLVLMASYSTTDLSQSNLKVLSLLGSNDEVLNMEKYEENKVNLPKDMKERIIVGGIHSYFGDYGIQKGDGNPKITVKEQRDIICIEMVKLME